MSLEENTGVSEELNTRSKWIANEIGPTKHDSSPALPIGPPKPYVDDLGPVGPWAFGRTEWNPTSGLTGVRQVVDRHSVTRFSPGDWQRQNEELTAGAQRARERAEQAFFSARATKRKVYQELDALHRDSSDELQQRAQEVWRWQCELQRTQRVLWDESQLLMEVPPRLHRMLDALSKAASVSSECIAIRCRRPEPDLVRDLAHEELVREAALVREVSALVCRCAEQARAQLDANRAAAGALEADWSCKADCYRVDSQARAITAHQQPLIALFQPGAASLPDRQVTPEGWAQSARENIAAAEEERRRSIALRTLLQPLLDNAVRDVREQAARVDDALAKNVTLLNRAVEHFDEQYRLTLEREAATELVIADLGVSVRSTEPNLKTAQSRLHTRQERMTSENCRDPPQARLLEEVAKVSAAASALEGQLRNAVNALHEVREERARNEAALVIKRRALHLNRDRVLPVREHFPSAGRLSGME